MGLLFSNPLCSTLETLLHLTESHFATHNPHALLVIPHVSHIKHIWVTNVRYMGLLTL